MPKLTTHYRTTCLLLALTLIIITSGCNLLAYPVYVATGGNGKRVPARYEGLKNTTVAILIAGDPEVEAQYPQAAPSISQALQRFITKNIKNVHFVPNSVIESYKMNHLQWYALPTSQIGQALNADRILYVDLYQFQMYESGSFQLLRGQIAATLKVYEIDSANPDSPVYKGQVQAEYPKGAPVAASDTALWSVMQRSSLLFADRAAKHFYTHKEQ